MSEVKVNASLLEVKPIVDERGALCFIEGIRDIPFSIQRMFWIFDVPSGAERGGHAHWKCSEAIFPVKGSFEIFVDDGHARQTFTITSPTQGIVIPAGVWCTLKNFSPGTVCLVAASMEYDPSGYVNDYETFLSSFR